MRLCQISCVHASHALLYGCLKHQGPCKAKISACICLFCAASCAIRCCSLGSTTSLTANVFACRPWQHTVHHVQQQLWVLQLHVCADSPSVVIALGS